MEEDSGVWKWCVSERSDHDRPQRQMEEHLQRKPEVKVKFYLFHQLHLSIYSGFGYAFQTPFLWKLLVFLLSVLKTQVEGNQITRWNIVILNGYNIQAKLFSAHCVGSPDFVVSFTQMCGEEELELPPTMPQGHRIISQYSLSDDFFCGDRWISNGAFILLISYLGNSWFNWIQAV